MTERNGKIDSLKGFLIILVILGHIIGSCGTGVICEDVWQIIYVFHMPLFILISGYLTNNNKDTKSFWQSQCRIFVPLVIFQILFVGIDAVFFRKFSFSYFYTPYWTLWYLLSLVFWRIMIRYTPKMLLAKPFLYFVITTIIAVFCGLMSHGRILSIQRTFNFYPFFLIGYYMKQGAFKTKIWPNYLSVGLVSVCILLITNNILPPPNIGYENSQLMLRGADHYTMSEVPLKIYYLLLSFVVSVSVLNIVPEIKLFSALGKESMFYYLYHGLIIRFILRPLVSSFQLPHSFQFMMIYLIGIIGLIFILRRIKPLRWLVSPTFSK